MFTVKREKERGGVYSRTGREGGGVNAAREKGELSGECWKDRDNVYSTGRRERWVFTVERGRQHWRGKGGGGAAVEAYRQNRMGKRESGGGVGSVAGRKQTITG